MSKQAKRVFISAGERSGDIHAAHLVRAVGQLRPELRFEGFGGEQLAAAGCRLHENVIHLSSMGLSFVSNIASFFRLVKRFYRVLRDDPPDVVVLVDFPGFNFILARLAKWFEIPVVYYICPQIWAWAPWRREKILRLTDLLMVIFPFEVDFYRSPGHRVEYVGHPLADELDALEPREVLEARLRQRLEIDDDTVLVGLFPGSRDQEIRELLPVFRRTVDGMGLDARRHRILVSCCRSEYRDAIHEHFAGSPIRFDVVEGAAYPLMASCDVALVASGTATLELAYFATPMVVFYQVSRIAYLGYRFICTTPFVSLVNILSGEEVVPERVSWRDDSALQAESASRFLTDQETRARCIEKLRGLRGDAFRPGGSTRAAETLVAFLGA